MFAHTLFCLLLCFLSIIYFLPFILLICFLSIIYFLPFIYLFSHLSVYHIVVYLFVYLYMYLNSYSFIKFSLNVTPKTTLQTRKKHRVEIKRMNHDRLVVFLSFVLSFCLSFFLSCFLACLLSFFLSSCLLSFLSLNNTMTGKSE